MFQKALQFKGVIVLCYNRQNIIGISGRVPPFFTWHIFQIVRNFLSFIVNACVLNQSNGL
jgi:hypothetical protein